MAETSDPRPAAPRWMRITLVVSLALNLAVAGLILGAVVSGPRDEGPSRLLRDVAGLPFVMALEPRDRRAVVSELRRETGSFRVGRREMRARLAALLEALRADEFDRAAVETLLGDQRGMAVARQDAGERILLDRVEAMTAAERRAYADRLEASLRKRPRR